MQRYKQYQMLLKKLINIKHISPKAISPLRALKISSKQQKEKIEKIILKYKQKVQNIIENIIT